MTYGVVLWTLLPQGLSMNWLMNKLNIGRRTRPGEEYERMVTLLQAKKESLAELDRMREEDLVSQRVYREFSQSLKTEIDDLDERLDRYEAMHGQMLEEQRREVKLRLLAAQQNAIREVTETGIASEDTARELMEELRNEYGDVREEG